MMLNQPPEALISAPAIDLEIAVKGQDLPRLKLPREVRIRQASARSIGSTFAETLQGAPLGSLKTKCEQRMPAYFRAATKDATARMGRMADEKLYKAEYQGSGTFIISKPKRKSRKIRQSKLKNPQRGARK